MYVRLFVCLKYLLKNTYVFKEIKNEQDLVLFKIFINHTLKYDSITSDLSHLKSKVKSMYRIERLENWIIGWNFEIRNGMGHYEKYFQQYTKLYHEITWFFFSQLIFSDHILCKKVGNFILTSLKTYECCLLFVTQVVLILRSCHILSLKARVSNFNR